MTPAGIKVQDFYGFPKVKMFIMQSASISYKTPARFKLNGFPRRSDARFDNSPDGEALLKGNVFMPFCCFIWITFDKSGLKNGCPFMMNKTAMLLSEITVITSSAKPWK